MEAIQEKVSALLNGYACRLLVILLVALPILAFVGDFLYTPVVSTYLENNAKAIALDLEDENIPPEEILRTMQERGLSWLYITDNGGAVQPHYKSFAPDLQSYINNPHLVSWHNKRYYEITADSKGHVVHAGYLCEPLWGLFHTGKIPIGYAFYLLCSTAMVAMITEYLFVSSRLKAIPERVKKTLAGAKPREQLDSKMVSSAVYNLDSELLTMCDGALKGIEKELEEAHGQVNEVMARDRQERFINKLAIEIQELESSDRVCDTVLHRVHDNFPNGIRFALSYKSTDKGFVLNGNLGLTNDQAKQLRKLATSESILKALADGKPLLVPGAAPEFALPKVHVSHTFVTPLFKNNMRFGALVFFLAVDDVSATLMLPTLKNVAEAAVRPLPTLVALEKQLDESRKDELTGVYNRRYLSTYVHQMTSEMKPGERISALLVEGDGFISLNDKYGRQSGDALIKQLCDLVYDMLVPDEDEIGSTPASAIFRYSAAQFLAVIPDCDGKKAGIFAEKLRLAVDRYNGWPAGVPNWTVSVSYASHPEDGEDIDKLIQELEITSSYLRQNKRTNFCLAANQVPKQFKTAKQGASMGGQLEVFEPAALLQSITANKSTGVLDVDGGEQGRFVLYLENGVAKRARLKKLAGDDAVLEFLTTFADGNFKFRDLSGSDNTDVESLFGLGISSTLQKPIEKQLIEGFFAKEKLTNARMMIKKTNLFVSKEVGSERPVVWDELSKLEEPPTPRELVVMDHIFKQAFGTHTLAEVLSQLENVPIAIVMNATAIMINQKIIKLSAIKVLSK